jgi:Peptidase family M23
VLPPAGFMSFPLKCGAPVGSDGNCNVPYASGAYTDNRINSILDHHMIPYPGTTFWQYGTARDRGGDGIITVFDGTTVGTGNDYSNVDASCIADPTGKISLDGLVIVPGPCDNGFVSYDEHPGYDYKALFGSEVRAVADGTVVCRIGKTTCAVGTQPTNADYCYTTFTQRSALCKEMGYLGIDHGNGYISQYGHLQVATILLKPGQQVHRGDLIALSGHTGLECKPHCPDHLHFEVLKVANDKLYFVDPYGWQDPSTSDPLYCLDTINCDPMRPTSIRLWE